MKAEDKRKLATNISLLDQALAPLTNAQKSVQDLADAEEEAVEGLENQDSDRTLERRDKLEELQGFAEKLDELVVMVEELKTEIEVW